MSKLAKRALIIFLTLSFVLILVPFSNIKVYAAINGTVYPYESDHYKLRALQSTANSVTVSWSPLNTDGAMYADQITIFIHDTNNTYNGKFTFFAYGTDTFVCPYNNSNPISYIEYFYNNTYYVSNAELYQFQLINQSLSSLYNKISQMYSEWDPALDELYSYLISAQWYIPAMYGQLNQIIQGLDLNYDVPIYSLSAYMNNHDHSSISKLEDGYTNQLNLGIHDYPVLKITQEYSSSNQSYSDGYSIPAGETVYYLFYSSYYTNNIITNWPNNYEVETIRNYSLGMYQYIVKIKNNANYSSSTNIILPLNSKIIPIYLGDINHCPQDVLNMFSLSNEYENQVSDISSDIDDTNSELNQTITDFDDIEQDLTANFNDNLDDIDFNVNPGTHFGTNFVNSISWVTQQFNSLITNTPFGDLLTFSLTLGVALLLIGRIL